MKPIEAICWTDMTPICIECIIGSNSYSNESEMDHRGHDVLNLEKSNQRLRLCLEGTENDIN